MLPPSLARAAVKASLGRAAMIQRSPTKYDPPYICAYSSQSRCPLPVAKASIEYLELTVEQTPWRKSAASTVMLGVQSRAEANCSTLAGLAVTLAIASGPPAATDNAATAAAMRLDLLI